MSVEIASLERVRDAVETIRRRNSTPTADRVIEVIGGGSKKTVLSHLRALRATLSPDDEVPIAVLDGARAALVDIYRAGGRAECERSRSAIERLSAALEEQEAQIDELANENARYSAEVSDLTRQRDTALSDRSRMEDRLAESMAVKQLLENELAAERTKRSESLEGAIARIETMVSTASKSNGARRTITLPRNGRSDTSSK